MSLGPTEILLCLFVALIVLGPEQLPKAARNIGRALAEFRKFNTAVQSQVNDFIKVEDSPKPTASEPPTPQIEPPDVSKFKQVDDVLETRPVAPPSDAEVTPSERRPSDLPE